WALQLASEPGEPVRSGSWWAEEAAAAVEASPEAIRARVEAALERVGDLPAVLLHGDFQPKNILVGGRSPIGILDWEHAHEAGPPGLDLLFLATMARSDRTDRGLLANLADGKDPAWASLPPVMSQEPLLVSPAAW